MNTQQILRAIATLRAPRRRESTICIPGGEGAGGGESAYQHEYRLAPRRRIDFFVDGVGVEIKKGRPNARELLLQVQRYLEADALKEIIVVTQKDTPLPARVNGKRVTSISLNRLWGVALP